MANPATTEDIEARWRPLTSDEFTVADALLADAWEILLLRVPLLQARLDDETLSAGLVVAAEAAMVLRVMRNPEGIRQESIDDYTWIRDNAVSAGLLYLTDDELTLLSPVGTSTGAFTITPVGAPGYATGFPLNWWELNL